MTNQRVRLADAHAHLFRSGYLGRYGRPSSGGDDVNVYRSLTLEHHIDLSLVVGYEGDTRYRGNNAYVANLARDHEWVAPLAYTPAGKPQAPGNPFLGVAVYLPSVADAVAFSNWPEHVIAELFKRRSIVSINAVPETLAVAADAIRRLTRCHVLISHLGMPGRFQSMPTKNQIGSTLKPLLSLSNAGTVGVKLSGLYALTSPMHAFPHMAVRPLIDRIADSFGTERLYWGSDFSPALDYVSFIQTAHAVSDLPWSDAQRAQVMGGNLRRVVGLARRAGRGHANR
ncbi:MAG TPA: amidohydrolase family protein [Candidatus Micrarchaeaceae archaeon]|nr:amidohydrolase family protein [Candidatus Micrarchaeaceae archaeon]